jgi:uncharacterized protein (DUF2249 family)
MDSACVFIDVTDLPPPEPLAIAMEAALQLKAGQYLQIHHWREPVLLYERLSRNNFEFDTRLGPQDSCEIFIWQQDDSAASESAQRAASSLLPWRE